MELRPVLEELDEVRGKEALSDASLAIEDDHKTLGHGCGGGEDSVRIRYWWDR